MLTSAMYAELQALTGKDRPTILEKLLNACENAAEMETLFPYFPHDKDTRKKILGKYLPKCTKLKEAEAMFSYFPNDYDSQKKIRERVSALSVPATPAAAPAAAPAAPRT